MKGFYKNKLEETKLAQFVSFFTLRRDLSRECITLKNFGPEVKYRTLHFESTGRVKNEMIVLNICFSANELCSSGRLAKSTYLAEIHE